MENEAGTGLLVEWWKSRAATTELEACISKLNEAQDANDLVHAFSEYANAFNLLWSGKARLDNDRKRSDNAGICDIFFSIPATRQKELCDSPEVAALASFAPQILNVKTLRESELYIPGKDMPRPS